MLVLALRLLSACTSGGEAGGDPKKRLTEYISKSFSVKSLEDRDKLAEFLTGDAKIRLVAWSEDQFRSAFIDSKREFIKLVVKEIKATSPRETDITYELTYLDQSRGKDAKVTNKKLAQLVQNDGRWYIAGVHNIKELVEYRNEMSLP